MRDSCSKTGELIAQGITEQVRRYNVRQHVNPDPVDTSALEARVQDAAQKLCNAGITFTESTRGFLLAAESTQSGPAVVPEVREVAAEVRQRIGMPPLRR